MENIELAKPSRQQLDWQDMEMGTFCHFGINTFYNQEWGDGSEDPQRFNPSQLNARQWVKLAKDAGFKYFILTAKHHDGFCLWPTKTTLHSVKSSPWKGGRGDVVYECAKACEEEGIGFGIYLSPWDRHEPCYKDKEKYDDFYAEQLKELLTGYGPLVEVWFDGAGSEGREYDWRRIMSLVKKYQPDAMVFNMGCPTIRWVGNEDGVAPYPCWNTAKEARVSMFTKDMLTWLPETSAWVPAECDVPIKKNHWFWSNDNEKHLLTLDELVDVYYKSVGHGCNLLLNVAPDNRGLIPDADAKRAMELGAEIRRRFSESMAETSGEGCEITLDLGSSSEVDHIILMEDIAFGERVKEYVVEAEIDCEGDTRWVEIVSGSAIGHKKIDIFEPVTAKKIRLRILRADDRPVIKRVSAFWVGKRQK